MSNSKDLIVVKDLDNRYSIVIGYGKGWENESEALYESEKETLQCRNGKIPCAFFVVYDKEAGDWADFAQEGFESYSEAFSRYKLNVKRQNPSILHLDDRYAITLVEEHSGDNSEASENFAFCFSDLQSGEIVFPEIRFETCGEAIAYYHEKLSGGRFVITDFRGKYMFLSNAYYHKDQPIRFGGNFFRTAEGAFQSRKCPVLSNLFFDCDGREAKKLGRRVNLRKDWNDVRVSVMYDVLTAKFGENEDLQQALLDTGDARIEPHNHNHENYWGSCDCADCASVKKGNVLGHLLMRVREDLRATC